MTRDEAIDIIKSECYVFNPFNFDRSTIVNTKLDMAIKALEQTTWIPVAERLPEIGPTVLMQNTGGWMFVAIYAVTPKRKYWAVLEHDYALDEAIAWMPLPEPYKLESEDKE